MVWQRQHVLGLADFSAEEYQIVLQTSASFREVLTRRLPKVPTLQGKVVATLFFEASTRTRNSFELAAKRLSADVLNFSPSTSSLSKGETILDTARTFLAMGSDLLIIRHAQAGVPHQLAAEIARRGSHTGVLNAGDGLHEHPTQGLLDLFTLCTQLEPDRPHLEVLRGVKIAIVGDILHSRVARSDIYALVAAGAEVHLAGPPTLLPKDFAQLIPSHTLPIHWQLDPALAGCRFVITLRLQQERMSELLLPSLREYHRFFGITRQRLQQCHPEVKLLHPGPVNRGVELSSEVMEDPQLNLIEQQVTHGVAVRMALLYLMGGGRIPA
ncbi:aspartate carbamoyltransferase catalytic subunit [Synechococcus sp. Nb3U1]|uniref:aspartate carbamoyltransferase catalytic subunit n=1 Tax=Synechococcus sp. Nb3U1 TaxID=1914529 RepID=UPI001F295325|nr:aspartate carbamoyltransferase catalytic subunit [Synechococcus sp. Nb3U1]MCF2970688.1 aspartate carbamoyltransferase catalytic subunit [Synechococcus sp. Nb3U1]